MRSLVLIALAGFAAFGAPQALPTLDKPQPVDFHVLTMAWHPKANGLMYTRQEGEGRAIGAFFMGQDQGTVVVHLGKEDRAETYWMEGKPNALVVAYRPFTDGGAKQVRVEVNLVDIEHGTAKTIFNRPFAETENPRLQVDTSPNLLHAIFNLSTGDVTKHYVLKTGSFDVLPSPDLDKAAGDGLSGPSWSQDGTAIFSTATGNDDVQKARILSDVERLKAAKEGVVLPPREVVGGERLARKEAEAALVISTIEDKRRMDKYNALGMLYRLNRGGAAPAAGATVLELMPQNATLRQVRFKGPWTEPPAIFEPLGPQNIPVLLNFGRSKGQSNSIWISRPDDKSQAGVLVSPNATSAWMAPRNQAVAYVTDGALFVRGITIKK